MNSIPQLALSFIPELGSRWTPEEDAILLSHYLSHERTQIAAILGRTKASIRKRCSILGLNTKHPAWTDEDTRVMVEWYKTHQDSPTFDMHLLAEKMERTRAFICRKARSMGLTDLKRGNKRTSEDRSATAKESIAKFGHPRGALGMRHSDATKARISQTTKAYAARMTPEEKEQKRMRRNKTCIEKYGTAGTTFLLSHNAYSRAKGGKRADLENRYFRSAWEANYARYLRFLVDKGEILLWEYEPQTYVFQGVTRGPLTYTPDFRITEMDGRVLYHEVKGWMDAKSKSKLKRMSKYYPEVSVLIIGKVEYKSISQYATLIEGWES